MTSAIDHDVAFLFLLSSFFLDSETKDYWNDQGMNSDEFSDKSTIIIIYIYIYIYFFFSFYLLPFPQ